MLRVAWQGRHSEDKKGRNEKRRVLNTATKNPGLDTSEGFSFSLPVSAETHEACVQPPSYS